MAYDLKWLDIVDDPRWDEVSVDQRQTMRNNWMKDRWYWSDMDTEDRYKANAVSKDFMERTNFQLEDDWRPHRERATDEAGSSQLKALGYGVMKGFTGGWWGPGGVEKFYETEEEKKYLDEIGAPTERKWGWLDEAEDHYWYELGGNVVGTLLPLGIFAKAARIPRALKLGKAVTIGARGIKALGGTMGQRVGTRLIRAAARGAQIGAFYGFYKKPTANEWKDLENPWEAPWNEGKWWAQKAQDVLLEAGLFAGIDGIFGAFAGAWNSASNAKKLGMSMRELVDADKKVIAEFGPGAKKLHNEFIGGIRKGASLIAKGKKKPYNQAAKDAVDILEQTLKDSDMQIHPDVAAKIKQTFKGAARPEISEVGKEKVLEGLKGLRKARYEPFKEHLYTRHRYGEIARKGDPSPLGSILHKTLIGRNEAQTELLNRLREELGTEMSDIGIFKEAMKRAQEGVPEFAAAFKEPPIFELMMPRGKPFNMVELLKEPVADAKLKMRDLIKEVMDIGDPQILKSLHNMEEQVVLHGSDVLRFNKQLAKLARDATIPVKHKEAYYDLHYGLMKSYQLARFMRTASNDLLHTGELALQKWSTTANLGEWHAHKIAKAIDDLFKLNNFKEASKQRVFYYMNGFKPGEAKWEARGLGKITKPELKIAETLREELDTLAALLRDAGVPLEYRAHYMPLIWKDKAEVIDSYKEYFGSRYLDPQARPAVKPGAKQTFDYAKQRKLELEDGLSQGLTPIEDPIALTQMYTRAAYRTLSNRNLVDTLQTLKIPWEGNWIEAIVPKARNLPRSAEKAWKTLEIRGLKPIKVAPGLFKQLKDIFDPNIRWWEFPGYKKYRSIRNDIKRLIMYNPIIHGSNIFSDVVNEQLRLWNPLTWVGAVPRAVKTMRRGWHLWKIRDDIVEEFVEMGGNISALQGLGTELAETIGNQIVKEIPNKSNILVEAWRSSRKAVDKTLWEYMVTSSQLGLYEQTKNLLAHAHPGVPKEWVSRSSAHYVNDLLGTLSPSIFSTLEREGLSTLFFARNWTISNLRLITGMLGWSKHFGAVPGKGLPGIMGHGVPLAKPEWLSKVGAPGFLKHSVGKREMAMLQPLYARHVARGLVMLVSSASLFQIGIQSMTNMLKDKGVLDTDRYGPKVKVGGVWSNQPGKRTSVDTGLVDARGNRIFFANFLFRYINDYVKWMFEPGKTFQNKMEPILKTTIETLMNYSIWRSEKIAAPGGEESWAEWAEKNDIPEWVGRKGYGVVARGKYVAEAILPDPLELLIPGLGDARYAKDPWEWGVELLTGTYKQRGILLEESAWTTLRKDHKTKFFAGLPYLEQEQLKKDLSEGVVRDAVGHKLLTFRQKLQYDRDSIDEQIDAALNQRPYPDVKLALELMSKYGRYTDMNQVHKKLKKHAKAIAKWQVEELKKIREAKEEKEHPGKQFAY